MIVIEEPHLQVKDGKARLMSKIRIPEAAYDVWVGRIGGMERYAGYEKMYQRGSGEFELWYETDAEFAHGMCCERSDAFVLAVIYFAMITGEDVKSLAPLSNEFAHSLNTYLIPLHCNERTGYRTIRVLAETEHALLDTAGENGTGISCGVDSLDTVLRYCEKDMDPEHRLTCLCLSNTGAFYNMPDMKKCIAGTMTVREWDEKAEAQFEAECVRGKRVADELGLSFVPVNSNISSLYQGAFLQSHAYRNCSAVLALEKLFGKDYPIDDLRYVPFTKRKHEFLMGTNKVWNSDASIETPVFEARVNNMIIFEDLFEEYEDAILEENGERVRLHKYPGLKVGSVKEANNNVGNWE